MKRRALLSTLGGSYLTLTAGCLSDKDGVTDTQATKTNPTPPPKDTEPETQTPDYEPRANLVVENEDDVNQTLSVRVRDGDDTIIDRSVDVSAGPGFGMSVEDTLVGEGTYHVAAELDTGATLDYEWRVTYERRRPQTPPATHRRQQ
ncbi:hypothetical protein E6P09_12720 [Haloferax mediterranei ATCC 33500]|uniref:Ig-like domain-containing protein n=1 Tax=Haloferax mediterranei (strain ATCC 33500 / DSM 1411 / JCM 8866 / NBRC 14739 / NCIMB 2177 / R-4) TaxID=523841 RepID=I3R8C3_HALMT|nr:hypothetical protein [Haloferax mediterranei]AHZ23844.1 hypothetical protein BM92_14855 [Haloferax mediterranei ATCC 33500]ELZ98268.1 hypothetical protein C439_15825 [Haloferax mediterranei ATCC 33500]MDX5986760.1 hypothetical protein [Haloferax mediterranei ATCC 33500]QCQ76084.1 hypothetical protein E6P09_12720 [Haloferax mediterranei ATCC 33500]